MKSRSCLSSVRCGVTEERGGERSTCWAFSVPDMKLAEASKQAARRYNLLRYGKITKQLLCLM